MWVMYPEDAELAPKPPKKKKDETKDEEKRRLRAERKHKIHLGWCKKFAKWRATSAYVPPPYGYWFLTPEHCLFKSKQFEDDNQEADKSEGKQKKVFA